MSRAKTRGSANGHTGELVRISKADQNFSLDDSHVGTDYNTARPDTSLDGLIPAGFVTRFKRGIRNTVSAYERGLVRGRIIRHLTSRVEVNQVACDDGVDSACREA